MRWQNSVQRLCSRWDKRGTDKEIWNLLASLPNSAKPVLATEWLEFKGYYQQEELKSLRPIWSECLSAFGNTEGGVLVWGLKANRKDGRDCVNGIAEVTAREAWKQKLKGWLLQAVSREGR